MNVLSVDLGTSNTVAVLAAHGRPPRVVDIDGASMMPSAVFAGDGELVVGREAERRARLDPARFEPNPKRRIDDGSLLLGDVVVSVTKALSAVLERVAVEVARQLGGSAPDYVRLTHPAQWGPVRRNVLLSAARQAGLGRNVLLVPEPVAAAAHYASFTGRTIAPGQAVAVYDLGAGTFDVAIVGATQSGFVVLAEAGLPDLGGLDVDQALLDHVGGQVRARDADLWQRLVTPVSTSDRRAARSLRQDVTAAKESLSSHPQTEVPLPDPFGDVLVTRQELDDLIRPNLTRSVELLAGTIRSAGLTPDALAGIYLVGGSSRIPLVAALITSGTGVVPSSLDQPETAVALGAHHMNPENVGLATHDLPPAAFQEPRTTAIAPPPRPAAQPAPPQQFAPQQHTPSQQFAPPQQFMPSQQFAPQFASPQFALQQQAPQQQFVPQPHQQSMPQHMPRPFAPQPGQPQDVKRRLTKFAAIALFATAALVLSALVDRFEVIVRKGVDDAADPAIAVVFVILLIIAGIKIFAGRGGQMLGGVCAGLVLVAPLSGLVRTLARGGSGGILLLVALVACVLCFMPQVRRGATVNKKR